MSRRLRVLYVTHEPNLTGASRSLLDLLAALDRGLVAPTVLVRKEGPLIGKLEELGIPIMSVPYGQSMRNTKSELMNLAKVSVNYFAACWIAGVLKREHFDLVHCNSLLQSVGMEAASLAKIPYVVHVRELGKEGHGITYLNEGRIRELMARANLNLFISEFVASKYSGWCGNAPIAVLYDAVDPLSYVFPHGAILGNKPVKLLLAGRFAPGKGQLEAIKAIEILNKRGVDAQLTLIGGIGYQDYYDECLRYVDKRQMANVRFLDFADDLSVLRAESDISLVCSLNEALGRVTVEGMMSGCLVIGADNGGTSELIQSGKTGLLYEPGKPESLSDCIEWAVFHPEAANAIALAGKKWAASHFDAATYARLVTDMYQQILSEQTPVCE